MVMAQKLAQELDRGGKQVKPSARRPTFQSRTRSCPRPGPPWTPPSQRHHRCAHLSTPVTGLCLIRPSCIVSSQSRCGTSSLCLTVPGWLALGEAEAPVASHHRSRHVLQRDAHATRRADLVHVNVEALERTPAVEANLVPRRFAPRQEGVTSGLVGRHWSGVSADQPRHLRGDPPDPGLAKAGLALQMGLQDPSSQGRLGLLPVSRLGEALELGPGLARETCLPRGDPQILMG